MDRTCTHPVVIAGQRVFWASGCYDDIRFHDPDVAVRVPVGGTVTLPPGARAAFVAVVRYDGAQLTVTPPPPLGAQRLATLVPPIGAAAACGDGSVPLVCTVQGIPWLAFTVA